MQIHHNPISMMLLRLSSMLVLIVALGACASQPAPAAPAAPAVPVADQTSAEADDHAEGEDYAHEGEARQKHKRPTTRMRSPSQQTTRTPTRMR